MYLSPSVKPAVIRRETCLDIKVLLVITIWPAISDSMASFLWHHTFHMPATGYEFLAVKQLSHEKSNHTAYFNI
jgi:hypothetical protein